MDDDAFVCFPQFGQLPRSPLDIKCEMETIKAKFLFTDSYMTSEKC